MESGTSGFIGEQALNLVSHSVFGKLGKNRQTVISCSIGQSHQLIHLVFKMAVACGPGFLDSFHQSRAETRSSQ